MYYAGTDHKLLYTANTSLEHLSIVENMKHFVCAVVSSLPINSNYLDLYHQAQKANIYLLPNHRIL